MPEQPDGLAPLTQRELQILQLIADGHNSRQIGARLYISEGTVKSHVQALLRKLGAAGRPHAVALGIGHGFITAPGT